MVKYFPLDKNYILKQAQVSAKPDFRRIFLSELQEAYLRIFNPLRLDDHTTRQVLKGKHPRWSNFDYFYTNLCAIYRYKFGENQLEIPFDGRTHQEKYLEEWQTIFIQWVRALCGDSYFVRSMLEILLFRANNHRVEMVNTRIKSLLNNHFELRIHKSRGILDKPAA